MSYPYHLTPLRLETRFGNKITWIYYREGFSGSKGDMLTPLQLETCFGDKKLLGFGKGMGSGALKGLGYGLERPVIIRIR